MKAGETVILYQPSEGAFVESWWGDRQEYDAAVERGFLLERQYDPPRPVAYNRIAFARIEEAKE